MPKTPSKMHIYDMVKINTSVFEIVGGGGFPPRIVSCLKYPVSDFFLQRRFYLKNRQKPTATLIYTNNIIYNI